MVSVIDFRLIDELSLAFRVLKKMYEQSQDCEVEKLKKQAVVQGLIHLDELFRRSQTQFKSLFLSKLAFSKSKTSKRMALKLSSIIR